MIKYTRDQVPPCFYRVSARALITNSQGKILLVLETGNKWDLPGGGIEWGETPYDALTRELIEETGLIPFKIAAKPIHIFFSELVCSYFFVYKTKLKENYILPKNTKFYSIEEMKKITLRVTVRMLLEKLKHV